jgi:hypothetical protein
MLRVWSATSITQLMRSYSSSLETTNLREADTVTVEKTDKIVRQTNTGK